MQVAVTIEAVGTDEAAGDRPTVAGQKPHTAAGYTNITPMLLLLLLVAVAEAGRHENRRQRRR